MFIPVQSAVYDIINDLVLELRLHTQKLRYLIKECTLKNLGT